MLRCVSRVVAVAALCCTLGCAPIARNHVPRAASRPVPLAGSADGRVNLWPVFYTSDSKVGLLWPLMEFDEEHASGRIVPLFWGEDYVVAFPMIWLMDDWQGVLPLFWWDDGFAVFPLLWYTSGDLTLFPVFWYDADNRYFHCFPLWLHWTEPSGHDTHVLWPLFRLVDTMDKKGFRAWPLLGHYDGKGRGGDWHYTYALWPLCHWREEGDEITRVVFPFYFEHGRKDRGWWLLAPVAFRRKDGADSLTITPLWSAGQKGETRWSALTPVYYRSVNEKEGTRRLITPLFARARSPERTEWMVVPLASSLAWGRGEKNLWLFGPLVHARWGGERPAKHHVLPLYYYDGAEKLLLTPLVSRQKLDGREFLNVGGVLAHYSRDEDGCKSLSFLWPLTAVSWGGKRNGEAVRLLPLFAWERRKLVEESRDPKRRFRATRREKWLWLAPWTFLTWSKSTPADEPGNAATAWQEHRSSAFPVWYYRHWHGTPRPSPAMRLPGRPEPGNTSETDFRLLGWLYEHHQRSALLPEETTTVWSRILWRLMRYEREGDDASLDIFPFITWDRKADGYRRFSFLWRLYRNERTAKGGRNVDVLFVPVLRE